jgi:hypothetical protein
MVLSVSFVTDTGAVNWPLRISAKGPYLEDQDGVPFLFIGDAVWYPTEMLSQTDMTAYLNDRKAKGFTAVEIALMDNYFTTSPPDDLSGNAPFSGCTSQTACTNWSTFNSAYWANVDWFITQAKNLGMLVIAFPAYTGWELSQEDWATEIDAQTSAAINTYGQAIGNRYKASAGFGNVIYVHGGDLGLGNDATELANVNAMASGILTADPAALQTVHWRRNYLATDSVFEGDSWLNLFANYTTCSSIDTTTATAYQIGMPFYMIEGLYEYETGSIDGLYGTNFYMQHQAMVSFLGGALVGHIYGNGNIWNLVPGTWDGPTGIDSPGSVSLGNISRLMRSREWWMLVPDYANAVVTSNKGLSTSYTATARTSDGATVMVWNPTGASVAVRMAQISGTTANGWSWDPSTNKATFLGTYATTGTRTFTPTAGTVLVLDDTSRNFGAPGAGLPLSTGWNLISLARQPVNTAIASVLSGITGAYEAVLAYPNEAWKFYDPSNQGNSTLQTMQAGTGYWIDMASAGTLTVSGSTPPSSLSLLKGWNLVGYNGSACASASKALSSLGGALQVSWGYAGQAWKVYDPNDKAGSTLTQFCPNNGYWIKVDQAATWSGW